MPDKLRRSALLQVGMFPVLLDCTLSSDGAACVPLPVVMLHEAQALRNHGQTVFCLAERGGLSPSELAAVLWDRSWYPMHAHEAWSSIFRAFAVQPNE